ncbi:hypothetical protein [Bacteroides fragilis]|uniref:hypothetical protein n=1 Tax=Bacteroides fragilis TaxID=817 RepID=UPI00028245B8|nr:hypothetical protein [Bacteroides fragilis]EKA82436.1 hypothetical protein HMPREF1205_02807 [Bacteroides fragilis HMW 616]
MTTTQINGITLTENAIKIIHSIQDYEHDWMRRSLEEAIDVLLGVDSCNLTDKEINCGVGLMGDCGWFRCAELRHEKGARVFLFHTIGF